MSTPSTDRRPLDRHRLDGGHPALMPDLTVEVVEETESTNALVAERARAGAQDGLVVVAEHQTAGRGRLDRTWVTAPGTSATFSMLLRPTRPAETWPWLPLLTGYAVDKALKAVGLDAGVKWPNDVLVGDLKIAGILLERVDTPDGPAAVVGVGVNVDHTADELPVETATSLSLALGRAVDRTDVLVQVLSAVREAYDAWEAGGEAASEHLAESYAAACVTVGRRVRVELPDGSTLLGEATGVDRSGCLQVRDDAGAPHTVAAGDVVHVRAI